MGSPLKQPSEIFNPDPRSTSFARLDATGQHPISLDDHHEKIAAVRISDGAPEGIRGEFDTVRNLHLYSWCVYEFTVPATLHACTLVEKAIKEKCERSAIALKGNQGLRKLMWLAVDQGWLTNADNCERLADWLPKLRNLSAHGEAGLGFPSTALGIIEMCACIINALFPEAQEPAGN